MRVQCLNKNANFFEQGYSLDQLDAIFESRFEHVFSTKRLIFLSKDELERITYINHQVEEFLEKNMLLDEAFVRMTKFYLKQLTVYTKEITEMDPKPAYDMLDLMVKVLNRWDTPLDTQVIAYLEIISKNIVKNERAFDIRNLTLDIIDVHNDQLFRDLTNIFYKHNPLPLYEFLAASDFDYVSQNRSLTLFNLGTDSVLNQSKYLKRYSYRKHLLQVGLTWLCTVYLQASNRNEYLKNDAVFKLLSFRDLVDDYIQISEIAYLKVQNLLDIVGNIVYKENYDSVKTNAYAYGNVSKYSYWRDAYSKLQTD